MTGVSRALNKLGVDIVLRIGYGVEIGHRRNSRERLFRKVKPFGRQYICWSEGVSIDLQHMIVSFPFVG